MSDIVIRVENLSKRYIIRHQAKGQRSGDGLRHAVQDAVTAPFRRFANRKHPSHSSISPKSPSAERPATEEFWALKDVSFEVERGEVLGIIGRNGAGKSTLLKILSRITEPTLGSIGINGHIASLLEVGTGFHHELTGRENIYLNGAILGMSRSEVRRKFDEIVSFAEVDRFIDTPVKRYSSGMYVRLAFAVAAHLDPEILIVDEVLAVGDSAFQAKCIGKMKQISQGGDRTVLFVSHDLSAVGALCNSVVYLQEGAVRALGPAPKVLGIFRERGFNSPNTRNVPELVEETNGGSIKFLSPSSTNFNPREALEFAARVTSRRRGAHCHFCIHIFDEKSEMVTTASTEYLQNGGLGEGAHELAITIHTPWLAPGNYYVNAFLYEAGNIIDGWEDACRFNVGPHVSSERFSEMSARNTGKTLSDFLIQKRSADSLPLAT